MIDEKKLTAGYTVSMDIDAVAVDIISRSVKQNEDVYLSRDVRRKEKNENSRRN